jgi:hypothetical protein
MPGMTLKITRGSPMHSRIVRELTWRVKLAERGRSDQEEKWRKAERAVAAYVPESTGDAKRRAAREDGQPTYTTIQIPYTYALLMAAHTYWTSVFFARSPVHQFEGRHGETEQQIQAMEALIAYQVRVGEMMAPYYLWLYDVGKYGLGVLGEWWCEEVHNFTKLVLDEKGEQVYVTSAVQGYTGNKIYNVAPYDFYPDPRLPAGRFQEGEFCAVYRTLSWNDLVKRQAQNYYVNVDEIKSAPVRQRAEVGDGQWLPRPLVAEYDGADDQKHPAWVGLYEVYVTLIPDEWGLGDMKMPEKWCFTITADFGIVIGAQPLGLQHDKYPFSVLEAEPEAYGIFSRGIPDVVEPIQNTMDWLVNSHFFNVRAIANGRFVADPSKVDLSQMENGEPGYIVALRPEAWGTVTDIRQVFQQIPMVDATSQHFVDFDRMFQIGERTTGINESIMGAFSGGRKTAAEVRTTTGFGVNRLKTGSEFMSAAGFSQHAQKLVQNTQQLMTTPMKVRIVGDLLQNAGPQFLMVNPQDIAGFYDLVPVDGTLPVDRFAQATLWKDLMGQMSRFPQIMASYDFARIFAWVANLAGLKNLNQFRVQVAPDAQLAQEAQAGNVIPFQGGGAPPGPGPQSNVATNPTVNVGG